MKVTTIIILLFCAVILKCDGLTNQETAEKIMGDNFFGVDDARKYFGIKPTKWQTNALKNIPFSEELLKENKDSHVLVAIFPVATFNFLYWDIDDKIGKKGENLLYPNDPYYYIDPYYGTLDEGQIHAVYQVRPCIGWRLIQKTPVKNSFSKNFLEQMALIKKNERVPTKEVMIYAVIGHYLKTGEKLFPCFYVRTSSALYKERLFRPIEFPWHFIVGSFDHRGIGLDWYVDVGSAIVGEKNEIISACWHALGIAVEIVPE